MRSVGKVNSWRAEYRRDMALEGMSQGRERFPGPQRFVQICWCVSYPEGSLFAPPIPSFKPDHEMSTPWEQGDRPVTRRDSLCHSPRAISPFLSPWRVPLEGHATPALGAAAGRALMNVIPWRQRGEEKPSPSPPALWLSPEGRRGLAPWPPS